MARILLAGYFGCGNLGDDSILQGYLHGMRAAGMAQDFYALSGDPEMTFRNYGVPASDRMNVRLVNDALEECDALVMPGGSLFQDATSTRSVAYYKELVIRAKKKGKKVLILGQGVGPLNSYFGKRMAAEAFKAADAVSVRDPVSLTTLQGLGVNRPVQVTADCALLLPPPVDVGEQFGVAGMKTIGIAPRPYGKPKDTVALFSEFCTLLYRAGMVPTLIEMDRKQDGDLIDLIEKKFGGRIAHIRKLDVPSTAQARIGRMESIVAMRLHAGILAAMMGIPPLMISYDPKTTAFSKMLGLSNPPMIEGLTAQRLFEQFLAHQRSQSRDRQVVAASIKDLIKLASGNLDLTRKTLGLTDTIGV